MAVEIYLQARMGSTRLPGKVLKEVLGRPLLSYQLERLRDVKSADAIVVLTTQHREDDRIEQFCQREQIVCFRGSCEDVLDRYYRCALQRSPTGIVRVTGDCPLIDPDVIDAVIAKWKGDSVDYLSNTLHRSYPRGLDVEIFSMQVLEAMWREASGEEREHVTPFCYQHAERFSLGELQLAPSQADHRWTVDTAEDFALIEKLLTVLYPINSHFRMADVLTVLQDHPEWYQLNSHVEQKRLVPPGAAG